MQIRKWTCGFFLVAAAVMAQTAPQNGKKLSARELFYAEAPPPAPAKAPAKAPAAKPVRQSVATAQPRPLPHPPLPPKSTATFQSRHPARTLFRWPIRLPPKNPGTALQLSAQRRRDEYREVDPDTVFHSGDRIRVAVQSNGEGYLYIVMKGASGTWKVLFPSAEVADGSNRVAAGRQTLIPPPPDRFAFDEQAGEERLSLCSRANPSPAWKN